VTFFRYELRTTNVNAARAFYSELLGSEFWGSDVTIVPLPEIAAARGAPAHWLGSIGVADIEAASDRVVAAGGQRLGRPAVRDPFGAVLALCSEPGLPSPGPVARQVHHSLDHERAKDFYSGLFGSTGHQLFVTAPSPQIHPQWLYFFRVSDIESSIERIRRLGGVAFEPTQTPAGDIFVPCDDPQGAAFGLIRSRG
jgi:hypothetical protein